MPRIKKSDLNSRGEAVNTAGQGLKSLLDAFLHAANDMDAGLKDDNLEFEFPAAATDSDKAKANSAKLAENLKALETARANLMNGLEAFNTAAAAQLFGFLNQNVSVLPGIPPGSPASISEKPPSADDEANFVAFLTKVGDAVLSTQRDLDRKSQAYIAESSRSAFAVPAAFRIPKLSGKMQVELEFDQRRGVNLIFNSRSDTSIRRNQQTIEFDIISVPAPAGSSDAVRRAAALDLVFDLGARTRLLDVSKTADKEDALPAEATDNPERILMLESLDEKGAPQHLVIYAGTVEKDSAVGMWLLRADGLQVVYPFQKTNSKFEQHLKHFAAGIAQAQADLIGPPPK